MLGVLLCLTMKIFIKRSFSHILENTGSIKKINLVELVLSYLMNEIEDFKTNKQSDIFGYLLFFMVMSLYIIYLMVNLEFVIKCEVLSICPKIYLQLFYYEHKLFEQIFSPLSTRPCPCIGAWRDNKL